MQHELYPSGRSAGADRMVHRSTVSHGSIDTIDVKNLCSRKLWELLNLRSSDRPNWHDCLLIEKELLAREHYLQELNQLRGQ